MIYIACPEKLATGGTELLHQLYYEISLLTNRVTIFYYDYSSDGSPTHERFKKYNVNYVTQIEDTTENALIIPEVATGMVKDYIHIKKHIWWLSVDNYYSTLGFSSNLFKTCVRILLKMSVGTYFRRSVRFSDPRMVHFAQSHYAFNFLMNKNAPCIEYLSDYIGQNFLQETVELTSLVRADRVLYNPKKGLEFTKFLMRCAPHIEFVPLVNLGQREVIDLCKKSKVYIDFGEHPGKDRFPREAAYLGCVVITGLRGSAYYYEDVNIPKEFKFEETKDNASRIIDKIQHSFDAYDTVIKGFEDYRQTISCEKSKFQMDVRTIWDKHLRQFA